MAVKKTTEKPKMGAPTKYKPEYCQQVIDHMTRGLSFESFAGFLGVTKSTIYNWLEEHKDFLDSKEIGMEACRFFWENLGAENMHDITEHGGINRKFNTTMWVFNMKNRFRKEWTEAQQTEANPTTPTNQVLTINVRADSSVEEFK